MAFQRGSTSFDKIPDFLERSKCVKVEKTAAFNVVKPILKTLSNVFNDAHKQFEDADAIEVIKMPGSSKLPTSAPWIVAGRPQYKPFVPPNRVTVVKQLELKLNERKRNVPTKQTRRKRAKPQKRRRTSASEDEGISLDDEDDDLSEEEDEPTSSDERFINDEEETEREYSDSEYVSEDSSESEGECSEENSEEDELALSGVEDDSDEDEIVDYAAAKEIQRRENTLLAQSAVAMKINRRMTPILTIVDTHLFNIIVCMFWAVRTPLRPGTTPLGDAIPTALSSIMNNTYLVESDASVGACFVWLTNHAKLRANLLENYESAALEEWLAGIQRSETLDDTPHFIYLPAKTQHCFLSGKPCNTGVQLRDVETQAPISTLWYDASDEKTNYWILNLVRFLFLPATLMQYCDIHLNHNNAKLSDEDMKNTCEWIRALNDDISVFLFEEGVTPEITAMLEKVASRNYVN